MDENEVIDWYISGSHANRALGYLSVALADLLPPDFTLPQLVDLWTIALEATLDVSDRSPVDAREFIK